jgi:hypothetical protein
MSDFMKIISVVLEFVKCGQTDRHGTFLLLFVLNMPEGHPIVCSVFSHIGDCVEE